MLIVTGSVAPWNPSSSATSSLTYEVSLPSFRKQFTSRRFRPCFRMTGTVLKATFLCWSGLRYFHPPCHRLVGAWCRRNEAGSGDACHTLQRSIHYLWNSFSQDGHSRGNGSKGRVSWQDSISSALSSLGKLHISKLGAFHYTLHSFDPSCRDWSTHRISLVCRRNFYDLPTALRARVQSCVWSQPLASDILILPLPSSSRPWETPLPCVLWSSDSTESRGVPESSRLRSCTACRPPNRLYAHCPWEWWPLSPGRPQTFPTPLRCSRVGASCSSVPPNGSEPDIWYHHPSIPICRFTRLEWIPQTSYCLAASPNRHASKRSILNCEESDVKSTQLVNAAYHRWKSILLPPNSGILILSSCFIESPPFACEFVMHSGVAPTPPFPEPRFVMVSDCAPTPPFSSSLMPPLATVSMLSMSCSAIPVDEAFFPVFFSIWSGSIRLRFTTQKRNDFNSHQRMCSSPAWQVIKCQNQLCN